jgi:hypothetical protein
VTLRARWVTLRARWVTLRARWVTLRARWVTLRARWVTVRWLRTAAEAAAATGSRWPVRVVVTHGMLLHTAPRGAGAGGGGSGAGEWARVQWGRAAGRLDAESAVVAHVERRRVGGTPVPERESVHRVDSHGRWERPCLQTAHMTVWY